MTHYHVFETAGGFCAIAWNGRGITRFQLPAQSAVETERLMLRRLSGAQAAEPPAEIEDAIAAVQRYFTGESIDFTTVTLDLDDQDDFFRAIYDAARKVGWGQTTTYGALAKGLGAGPEAARDVGVAMARNPVALIIPCHRVLAAGNKPGGFSVPGGVMSKLHMLELEGVRLSPPPPPPSAQQAFDF